MGNMVCTEEKRNTYRVLVGKLEGKEHLADLGIDVMILKSLLKK
jgi:hypothetical protein